MATIDLVVLSSSPPDASCISPNDGPPSPPPRAVRGALRSGSRAARIPDGIYTGFASSASLLPSGSLPTLHPSPSSANRLLNETRNKTTDAVKDGQWRKREGCAEDSHDHGHLQGMSKARSSANDHLQSEDNGASGPVMSEITSHKLKDGEKPTKSRKKRSRKLKESEQNQSTLSPGKVTKPRCKNDRESSSRPDDVQKRKKATEAASGHFSKLAKTKKRKSDITEDGGLGLEEAVKRRTDWTPPKAETRPCPGTDHELGSLITDKSPQGEEAQRGFGNMMDIFAYAGETAFQATRDYSSSGGFTKSKEIELMRKSVASKANESPTKIRHTANRNTSPPKKKIKTITGLATAQFLANSEALSIANDGSNFKPQNVGRITQDAPIFSKPGAIKTTKKGGAKKKPQSTKSKKDPPAKLLSPSAAAAKFLNQDILFGTSSQLAKEESPDVTRDIQAALKASEQAEIVTTRDTSHGLFTSIGRYKRARDGLWSAANRDFEDGLLVEDQHQEEHQKLQEELQEVEFPDIDNFMDQAQEPGSKHQDLHYNAKPMLFPMTADQSVELGGNTSRQNSAIVISSSPHPVVRLSPLSTPNRPTLCTPSLSPVSNPTIRSPPIATFVHTKARTSPDPLQQTILEHPKPKRPRGRPRKAKVDEEAMGKPTKKATKRSMSVTTPRKRAPKTSVVSQSQNSIETNGKGHRDEWIDIDEIEDPAPELSPTPPRRRQKKAAESQLEVTENSTDLSWTALQQSVLSQITEAVRAAKAGTLDEPSWHEKILLYDAIDPEALTKWLNSNNPDGWANGKLTELQSWMVQKWCEDKSICCISGDARTGRRRRT